MTRREVGDYNPTPPTDEECDRIRRLLEAERDAAVEELVAAVEGLAKRDDTEYLLASPINADRLLRSLAWDIDPHATNEDVHVVEAAADELKERLGE